MNRRGRYLVVAAVLAASLLGAGAAAPVTASATPATAPAAGDLWPMFGQNPWHSGLSSDAAISASSASRLHRRWSASLSSSIAQASPAVAYNRRLGETLLYDVTYTGALSAFNAATGAVVWQRSLGDKVASSPAVYNGTIYIGTLSGTLEALNAATGRVRCTFKVPVIPPATAPGRIISSPVVGAVDKTGATVFFGDAGTREADNGGHFWAVTAAGNSLGGCKERWMYDNWPNKGTSGNLTGVWDEPALARASNGAWEVVFGTSNPDQAVYALNAVNGSELWRFQTQNFGPDEDVGAGPTIGAPGSNGFTHGVVYIDGKDGIEYALDLATGKKLWSFTLGPGSNAADGVSEAALSGHRLVVCYAATVFELNASTGKVMWTTTPGGDFRASPAIAGPAGRRILFVGDLEGNEYGLSLRNGAKRFSLSTGSQFEASSAVAAGTLYFVAGNTFYAYAP